MNYKNKFIIIYAILIFSVPINNSFSKNINSISDKVSSLYISFQHKYSFSVFSDFSVKYPMSTTQLLALKKDVDSIKINPDPTLSQGTSSTSSGISKASNFNLPYIAKFEDNYAHFNGTIGYLFTKNLRIEIEGFYEKFDAKNPGDYKIKDAFRYFALTDNMENGIPRTSSTTIINACSVRNGCVSKHHHTSYHTVMKNDGLAILSVIINSCYSFLFNNTLISPYICAGIGVDAIELFDVLHIKLAIQNKLGITYPISSKISLFADGYYHQVIGNQFKNLYVQSVAEFTEYMDRSFYAQTPYAVATLNVASLGCEIGVRFKF